MCVIILYHHELGVRASKNDMTLKCEHNVTSPSRRIFIIHNIMLKTHPAQNAIHNPIITVKAYSARVCSFIDLGGGASDTI